MPHVTVDFIAKGISPNQWAMVLVEEGPWPKGDLENQLRRVQDRLYGCIDAAIDGQLAEQSPESKGKTVTVRLDCYNVPQAEVKEFFERFSKQVLLLPDYREALKNSPFLASLSFEVTFDSIH